MSTDDLARRIERRATALLWTIVVQAALIVALSLIIIFA